MEHGRTGGEPDRGDLDPFLIDRISDLSHESRWAEVAPLLEQLRSPPELIVEAHLKVNCVAEAISYVERLVTAKENDDGVDVVISELSTLLITPAYGDFDAGGTFVLWLSNYFGNFLEAHERWARAANLWDIAGETVRAATAFENAGDLRRAASRFADSGQFQRAAELWDRVGEEQRAQGARDLAVLDEDDAE